MNQLNKLSIRNAGKTKHLYLQIRRSRRSALAHICKSESVGHFDLRKSADRDRKAILLGADAQIEIEQSFRLAQTRKLKTNSCFIRRKCADRNQIIVSLGASARYETSKNRR